MRTLVVVSNEKKILMTLVLSWCSFERLISPKMQPHPFSHLRNVDGGGNQLKLDNLT